MGEESAERIMLIGLSFLLSIRAYLVIWRIRWPDVVTDKGNPRKRVVSCRQSIAIPAFLKESFENRSRISASTISAAMVIVNYQITTGKDTVSSDVTRCQSPNLKTRLDSLQQTNFER